MILDEVTDLEPMGPSALIVIILYSVIVFQIFVLFHSLFKKWRHRRSLAIRNLSWSFFSYMLAFICLLVTALEGYVTGYKQDLYRIFMGLGYFFLMFGHVLFLTFAKKIYGFNQKSMWKYEGGGILIAIFVVLPQNYYGVPTGQEGPCNIRLYSSLAMLIYSLSIFTLISIRTFKSYQRMKLKYARYGFLGFFIPQVAMICVFLFVLGDFIYWFVFMLAGYTVFYYLAVVSGMISIAGFYLGIVVPPYLQQQRITTAIETTISHKAEKTLLRLRMKSDIPAITIQCPECRKFLYYEITSTIMEARMANPKELVSISIPPEIICEHTFVIYVDKRFEVRSVSSIDHDHHTPLE